MEWTLKTRLLLMRYGMAEYESKIRNTTLQYECLRHMITSKCLQVNFDIPKLGYSTFLLIF